MAKTAKKKKLIAACCNTYYLPAYYAPRHVHHQVLPNNSCLLSFAFGTGSTEFDYNLASHHAYIIKHELTLTGVCLLTIEQLARTPVPPPATSQTSSGASALAPLPPDPSTCSCPASGQTIPCPSGTVPFCPSLTGLMECRRPEPPETRKR